MRVQLVVNQQTKTYNLLVSLKEKNMQDMVITMLKKNRGREAFRLIKTQGEVEACFPIGMPPPIPPVFTLVEDDVR